jgi:hypothetical protein
MVEHGRPAVFDQETVSDVCTCVRSGNGKVCNTLAGPFDLFMSWAVGLTCGPFDLCRLTCVVGFHRSFAGLQFCWFFRSWDRADRTNSVLF